MRLIFIVFILIFVSCKEKNNGIDYPKNINEIESVNLLRPDEKSNGKLAEIKYLEKNEIAELLAAIKNANEFGMIKFKPDYYIEFVTKNDGTKRIKVNGNKIKGYKNDIGYEIAKLNFMTEF
ncbi:hypothetical protein [Gelidibacter japonicus]|uniref:hypothetical protein n=1 Tax=Gelidibacter japonicus TaxID=1962232 RepID=UPI0013D51821|nr:hypothetical protein [Gelidibacter japonicus]